MFLSISNLWEHGSPNDTANKKRLHRDTFVEFVATTLFVFSGTLAVCSTGLKLVGQGDAASVARVLPIAFVFGVSIMTLAYSIGHMTGGHMNPGVSLLMFLRRQISFVKMLYYWFAQFFGATIGACLTWACVSSLAGEDKGLWGHYNRPPFELGANSLDSTVSQGNGFMLEFMGSLVFYFVIAQTALDKRGIASTSFPAIPIGFSLIVVHICLIPFTGCGVNPARTFGPSVVVCMAEGSENCEAVAGSWYWIYYIAPLLAAWVVSEITLIMEMDVSEEQVPLLKESPAEAEAMEAAKSATKDDNMNLPEAEIDVENPAAEGS